MSHSVTQSTFDDPCTPLDGGFNSGLAGVGTGGVTSPPVWNLTITDDSERMELQFPSRKLCLSGFLIYHTIIAIYYFCEVEEPASHCISGMVG